MKKFGKDYLYEKNLFYFNIIGNILFTIFSYRSKYGKEYSLVCSAGQQAGLFGLCSRNHVSSWMECGNAAFGVYRRQ